MRIEHIAMWVEDLEGMKDFYTRYFSAISGSKYINEKKRFQSYFLSFNNGCRLELMHHPDLQKNEVENGLKRMGLIHLAFSVGGRQEVDSLTRKLEQDGFEIEGAPRTTGDGYYESVVLDPEGNHIEITI